MEEIRKIIEKYDESYVSEKLTTVANINAFAYTFYKDVADIYDAITRVRNIERNPTGFSINEAPILGLLVRTWKLLKEIIYYYEQNNAEIISILERPLIEGCVVASYLLKGDDELIKDYRKCSYKDRLRILRNLEEGAPFFETKAGKRLAMSVRGKLARENLTTNDFEVQKKNGWKINGKKFYDIFSLIHHKDLYACTYGMMSESIHGSWNESMDFCLTRNGDGTFSTFPFSHPADVRCVSPTLLFTNDPYRLWLRRIEVDDKYLMGVLDWVERVNTALFHKFDDVYDG